MTTTPKQMTLERASADIDDCLLGGLAGPARMRRWKAALDAELAKQRNVDELLSQIDEGKQHWDQVAALLGADGDNVDDVIEKAKQRSSPNEITLSEALNCLEDHALAGHTMQGDDVDRMQAVTDKLTGRRNDEPVASEYLRTHEGKIRMAICLARKHAEVLPTETDDAALWNHELKALDEAIEGTNPPQRNAAEVTDDPRFFIDHEMIHDRVTGMHVTCDRDEESIDMGGYSITVRHPDGIRATLKLLNELHCAALSAVASRDREDAERYRWIIRNVDRIETDAWIWERDGVGDGMQIDLHERIDAASKGESHE